MSQLLNISGERDMIEFSINGESKQVDTDPATPILWVVREQLGLNGTKFGCGIAQCGACTVHLDPLRWQRPMEKLSPR